MQFQTTNRAELLEQGSDARFRQLVYDLFTLSTHMQNVRDHIAGHIGVSGPQYSIIMAIAEMQGDIAVSVKRIAEHLHVSGAFVTAETGKLNKAGFLDKNQNPEDRRGVRLTLSLKGLQEIEKILPELNRINEVFFGNLSQQEFLALSSIAASMIKPAQQAIKNTATDE
jgi:DNA-binding MarR family transcriptional regulator